MNARTAFRHFPVRPKSAPSTIFVLVAISVALSAPALGDAGVFTGNGQNLHQVGTKKVQLMSIDVTIAPGRGPFLFDGTVPGMDRTQFYCAFVLRSLSSKKEEVEIGFPVDSEFARGDRNGSAEISPKESNQWISDYSFIARDERTTYNVTFVRRKKAASGEFSELFTWKMSFAPRETRTLIVQYQIPMTMGLTSTSTHENVHYNPNDPLQQELLNVAMEEVVGYITSTGSSWAGNVQSATFTVITAPFERYLDFRGIGEAPPDDADETHSQEENNYRNGFPVQHPWWFRKISPGGWKREENGIRWHYQTYKPHDPIVVSYFMTQFPRLPAEAGAFVDRFLENLSRTDSESSLARQLDRPLRPDATVRNSSRRVISTTGALEELKELLLATYGKEPESEMLKRHVAAQLWYEPRPDFRIENLTRAQRVILNQIDVRIQAAKKIQSPAKN